MSLFLSNKAIIKKSHNVKLRGPGISESSLICCNLEADWWIISNLEPTENLDWQNKFHRTMPSFHWVCGIIFTAYSSHSCDLHLFQQRSHILGWFVPCLGTRCIWVLHHLCAVLVGDGAQHWPSTVAAKLEQRCPGSALQGFSFRALSMCLLWSPKVCPEHCGSIWNLQRSFGLEHRLRMALKHKSPQTAEA